MAHGFPPGIRIEFDSQAPLFFAMFTGSLNSSARSHLAGQSSAFAGKTVVVGCSGNFTVETVLSQAAKPAALHGNDVSLYSCALGRWLAGQPVQYEVADREFDWLTPLLRDDERRVAALPVLLEMLEFQPRDNQHRVRMWGLYRETFDSLLEQQLQRLEKLDLRLASFYAGDVLDHFRRFENEAGAVFVCFAPTYTGGYERVCRRLEATLSWQKPPYPVLDNNRSGELLAWMQERPFLWYDDRLLDGMTPVASFKTGRLRAVYLYSNVVGPAYVAGYQDAALPALPLAGADLRLTPDTTITLYRIKTSDLARFKAAFLGRGIIYAPGMWAFAILANGKAIGFLEFNVQLSTEVGLLYQQADFGIPGTPYPRLSKLVVMLAIAGETRRMLERLNEMRLYHVRTTAFTERAVSMKYRGVYELERRSQTADGQKYINYRAAFNDLSWQETYRQWLNKHGSMKQSSN